MWWFVQILFFGNNVLITLVWFKGIQQRSNAWLLISSSRTFKCRSSDKDEYLIIWDNRVYLYYLYVYRIWKSSFNRFSRFNASSTVSLPSTLWNFLHPIPEQLYDFIITTHPTQPSLCWNFLTNNHRENWLSRMREKAHPMNSKLTSWKHLLAVTR